MHKLHLAAIVLVMGHVHHLAPGTNAAPWHQPPPDQRGSVERLKPPAANIRNCANRAADVARVAARTCGNLLIEEALFSVTMPAAAAQKAGEVLAALGFDAPLDLELLEAAGMRRRSCLQS